ncbi:MAG: mechanosensitive ion channel [Flavobacteriales bacterium]|nr:mechanosensitive ion channel [Flavobacteriales bacterium]MCB0770540.1 mechanosensitive ion channel [Flavobacteriales bacterium]
MLLKIRDLLSRIESALHRTLENLVEQLPLLLLAGTVILVGWGLARLLRWLVRRLTVIGRLEALSERLGLTPLLLRLKIKSVAHLIGGIVYWLAMLGTIMLAADVLGMQPVIRGLERMFAYLPSLIASLAVFIFGFWLADKARFVMGAMGEAMGLASGKAIGRILFVVILLFLTITALNVAGIDTSLITSNILIVVGSLFISFSIAYGFAARDILSNILSGYYNKDRLRPGQRIRIGDDEGIIVRISGISVTLRTRDRTVHLPSTRLVNERIEVLDDASSLDEGNERTAE